MNAWLCKRVSDCCLTPKEQYCSYIMARTSYIWWDDYDNGLIKLIPSWPIFALTPKYDVLRSQWLDPTRGEHANHYTTDAVPVNEIHSYINW